MREDLRLGEKENQIQQNIVSTMWFCFVRLLGAVGLSAAEVSSVCVCVSFLHIKGMKSGSMSTICSICNALCCYMSVFVFTCERVEVFGCVCGYMCVCVSEPV